MRLAFKVAFRYFLAGKAQSGLLVALVAVGALFVTFNTSLLVGVQRLSVDQAIGTSSHATVEPFTREPNFLALNKDEIGLAQASIEREPKISEWESLVERLEKVPNVEAVSPVVLSSGFMIRGERDRQIGIEGVDPERQLGILDIRARIVEGAWDLGARKVVIGVELAELLEVTVGEKVQIRTAAGREALYTVSGIYRAVTQGQGERNVYVSIPDGQRLENLVGYVSQIETQLKDPFLIDLTAAKLGDVSNLKVVPWTVVNPTLTSTISQIDQTSNLSRNLALIAVAFGIASALGVTALQKSREIGILKAMGAKTGQILMIFLLQGTIIGIAGALVGCGLGAALVLSLLPVPQDPSLPVVDDGLPIIWEPAFVLNAGISVLVICLLAGLGPARRAAKMDPVEVIRYG